MSHDAGLSYGMLVSNSLDEDRTDIPEEELAMEEQTQLMIEEAAYYIAEKRGFVPGYEMQDWLQARDQILKHYHH